MDLIFEAWSIGRAVIIGHSGSLAVDDNDEWSGGIVEDAVDLADAHSDDLVGAHEVPCTGSPRGSRLEHIRPSADLRATATDSGQVRKHEEVSS
jgi:hypothetical protein